MPDRQPPGTRRPLDSSHAAALRRHPDLSRALTVARRLREAGHEVYLCGGAVRDLLLGIEPADLDLATDATPERIEALFARTVPTGKQFGVVQVVEGGGPLEVATFRADGAYTDGRRPSAVRYGTLADDVARRDFTVNALMLDLDSLEVTDLVGGRADLDARLLRAVGDARVRFDEDALRLMRAVRFACARDLAIEPATRAALGACAAGLARISAERITHELERILASSAPGRGLRLLAETGLLAVALPEVAQLGPVAEVGEGSIEGRTPDPLEAAALALDRLPTGDAMLGLAAILRALTPDLAAAALDRLALPNVRRKRALDLARAARDLPALAVAPIAERKRVLREDWAPGLVELARAVALAGTGDLAPYLSLRLDRQRWIQERSLFPPKLLDGDALLALGVPRGPGMGALVRALEDAQLAGTVADTAGATAWVARALAGEGSA